MRPSILLSSILSPILGLSCSSNQVSDTAAPPVPPTHLAPATLGSIAQLHAVGTVFLASQPSAEDLRRAEEAGVRTVINLRHESEQDFDERAVAGQLGLVYRNLPFGSPEELTDAVLDEGRRLLRESEGPILLHCASANRVGAIWVAHRVLDDHIDVEDAVSEARTAGLRSAALEARAREYVAQRE